MFEDKLKAEATLEHFQAGAGSPFRSSFKVGDRASGEDGPKSSGKGRLRNSCAPCAQTGAGGRAGRAPPGGLLP